MKRSFVWDKAVVVLVIMIIMFSRLHVDWGVNTSCDASHSLTAPSSISEHSLKMPEGGDGWGVGGGGWCVPKQNAYWKVSS